MTRPMLMAVLGLTAALSGGAAAAGPDKWQPYLEFHADLASDQRAAGGAEIFVPLWQHRQSILFGDFRGPVDGRQNGDGGTGAGAAADDVSIPRAARKQHQH